MPSDEGGEKPTTILHREGARRGAPAEESAAMQLTKGLSHVRRRLEAQSQAGGQDAISLTDNSCFTQVLNFSEERFRASYH